MCEVLCRFSKKRIKVASNSYQPVRRLCSSAYIISASASLGLTIRDLEEIPVWILAEALEAKYEANSSNATNIREATQADMDLF